MNNTLIQIIIDHNAVSTSISIKFIKLWSVNGRHNYKKVSIQNINIKNNEILSINFFSIFFYNCDIEKYNLLK